MASSNQSGPSHQIQRLRHRFAFNLGVTQSRKMALYGDLLNSVSLFDITGVVLGWNCHARTCPQ